MRKVIISLAPVAGPAPVDPDRLAEDVARSVQAGALVATDERMPIFFPAATAFSATGSSTLITGIGINGRICLVTEFTEVQVTRIASAPASAAHMK